MVERYNTEKMKMTPERNSRKKILGKLMLEEDVSSRDSPQEPAEKNNNIAKSSGGKSPPGGETGSYRVTDLDAPEQESSKSFVRLRFSARRCKKQDKTPQSPKDAESMKPLDDTRHYVSNVNLLEEIASELAPKYSLTSPLEHAPITLSGYRTVTRLARLSLSCPDDFQVVPTDKTEQEDEEGTGEAEKQIRALQVEAMVQEMKKRQSEKALTLCKEATMEWIEGQKALLLSDLRLEAITWEIKRLSHDLKAAPNDEIEPIGYLNISSIVVRLQEDAVCLSSTATGLGSYLIVATEKDRIVSTPMLCPEDGVLEFQNMLHFQRLHSQFIISLYIYQLQPNKVQRTSKKGKARKMFQAATHNILSVLHRHHRAAPQRSLLLTPSHNFTCVGRTSLSLDHLNQDTASKKAEVRLVCNQAEIKLTLSWGIDLETKHTGFLNVLRPTWRVWRRLWLVLQGTYLEGWNYPEDVGDKPPLECLLLSTVQDQRVQAASLDICVRPYTFNLDLKDGTRILYSADSTRHMKLWCLNLNRVLGALKVWKITP